jgi:ribosomal protein S18 acetylase RimI-like enzyme
MLALPTVNLERNEAVAVQIATALQNWNEQQVGPRNTEHFALTVRAEDGELVAGLVAEMFWTVLYVSNLWVKDNYRRRGYGTALLQRAEAIARARPCHVGFLSTMTFQAPAFYEKCGYEAFGQLPHVPEPFGRIWLAKRLL